MHPSFLQNLAKYKYVIKRWCPTKFLEFPGKCSNSSEQTIADLPRCLWDNVKQVNFKMQSSDSGPGFLLLHNNKVWEFFLWFCFCFTHLFFQSHKVFFKTAINSTKSVVRILWIWDNAQLFSFHSYVKLTPNYLQGSTQPKNFPKVLTLHLLQLNKQCTQGKKNATM